MGTAHALPPVPDFDVEDDAPSTIHPHEWIADSRAAAGITQSQAAAFAFTSTRQWRRYESGRDAMPEPTRILYLLRAGLTSWDDAARAIVPPPVAAWRASRLAASFSAAPSA